MNTQAQRSGKSRHSGDAFEGAFANKLKLWFQQRGIPLSLDASERFYAKQHKLAEDPVRGKKETAALIAVEFALEQSPTFFASKGEYVLRLNDDAADHFDVRDATLVNPRRAELGFSLKWANAEIKSPRLQLGWLEKFQLPDDGWYEQRTADIVRQLSSFATWKEAKESLGDEAVHRPFNDGLVRGIEQIRTDPIATHLFARFMFGSVAHVKVIVPDPPTRVLLADYHPKDLPTTIKEVYPDPRNVRWAWIEFDKGWTLKLRLHSRKEDIPANVRSSMGLGVTVEHWGSKQVLIKRLDNANQPLRVSAHRSTVPGVSQPPLHPKQRLSRAAASLSGVD